MISRKGQTGNTLLEVLISMSLLVTGVLAYFQLDAKLINGNHLVMQMTEATLLLQNQMESLAEIGNIGDTGVDTIVFNSHSYDVNWTIADIPSGKAVSVSIAWKNDKGEYSDNTRLDLIGHYDNRELLAQALISPPPPITP